MKTPRELVRSLLVVLLLLAPSSGQGAPLNLQDSSPRSVLVQFETSATVDLYDQQYSDAIPAFLFPNGDGTIRVGVLAPDVEDHLTGGTGQGIIPGSFTNYVWTFDPTSNHVLTAIVSGQLVLGVVGEPTGVGIVQELTTFGREPIGYSPEMVGRGILDLVCSPATDPDCIEVERVPYQPDTGYVRAFGAITFGEPFAIQLLSSFGEAIFSENVYGDVDGDGTVDVTDAQCLILASHAALLGDPEPECVAPGIPGPDLNCDGFVGVGDVNLVISLALSKPLDAAVDGDQNGIHDACEPLGVVFP